MRIIQCPLFGDVVAEQKFLTEKLRAADSIIESQQSIIKQQNKSVRVDWEKRKARLSEVCEQVLDVVIRYPGLRQKDELGDQFEKCYKYKPLIDNRVRDLRKAGKVFTVPGTDGLLRVYPRADQR
jgi:hypothetical protein